MQRTGGLLGAVGYRVAEVKTHLGYLLSGEALTLWAVGPWSKASLLPSMHTLRRREDPSGVLQIRPKYVPILALQVPKFLARSLPRV